MCLLCSSQQVGRASLAAAENTSQGRAGLLSQLVVNALHPKASFPGLVCPVLGSLRVLFTAVALCIHLANQCLLLDVPSLCFCQSIIKPALHCLLHHQLQWHRRRSCARLAGCSDCPSLSTRGRWQVGRWRCVAAPTRLPLLLVGCCAAEWSGP